MKPIADKVEVEQLRSLLNKMMTRSKDEWDDLNPSWIESQGWIVVPVESMARIPPADIPRLVAAFSDAGYREALVLATEPLGDLPVCYRLRIDEADLIALNRQLGPFRFLVTPADGSWAIACTEWYNLFAARPPLLEAILGSPIAQARQQFLEFVMTLAHDDPDYPLLLLAARYAKTDASKGLS